VSVTVTREIIHVDSVKGDAYAPNGDWDFLIDKDSKIAYVRIEQFHDNTAEELERVLQNLREQGMKGLVLDLRFNPGGLLTTAVKTCDLFISEGVIVSTQARNAQPVVYEAHRPRTFEGFPVAVLINQRSASASEIVAACLQDHKRGVLVGERTWGKGSVQNIIDLGDGRGAMKLTTASYHRPSGKNIHRFEDAKESDVWGVSPTEGYEVSLNAPERLAGKSKGEARRLELQAMGEWFGDRLRRDVMPRPGQTTPSAATEDRQLKRALEYLRGEVQKQPAA
jgi:carboxyl-terminal processing protease